MGARRVSLAVSTSLFLLVLLASLLAARPAAWAADDGVAEVATAYSSSSYAVKRDGSLWAWGLNNMGQLGVGDFEDRPSPVEVMDGVAEVEASYRNAFAVKRDGSLWAWGDNGSGRLGVGDTRYRPSPVEVLGGVAEVESDGFSSFAVKRDGSLWAWGWNDRGQLGVGDTDDRHSPVKVMDGVAEVAAGDRNAYAVKRDGSLWAWGDNGSGELGVGDTQGRLSPVKVMDGVAGVESDGSSSFAVKRDGSLWAWGANGSGELGVGDTQHRRSPVEVMDGVAEVTTVHGAENVKTAHGATFAVKRDGSLWAWGYNYDSQLGVGDTGDRHSPVKVMDGVAEVESDGFSSFAVKRDGSLWAWGANGGGRLGVGETGGVRHSPVKVMDGVERVTTSDGNAFAVKRDGSLWAWGQNPSGMLGVGDTEDHYSPVKVKFDGSSTPPAPTTGLIFDSLDPVGVGQVRTYSFRYVNPNSPDILSEFRKYKWTVQRDSIAVIHDISSELAEDGAVRGTITIGGIKAGETDVFISMPSEGISGYSIALSVKSLYKDEDGDALDDSWEASKEGQALGAVVGKKDIFVEVDWMVKPEIKFFGWTAKASKSFKPSDQQMILVAKAFEKHGIRLHIDSGPDSTNYPTGRKWGDLSRASEVPYREKFDSLVKEDWSDVYGLANANAKDGSGEENFSSGRRGHFHYALSVDQYDDTDRSGTSSQPIWKEDDDNSDTPVFSLGGQYFIVAAGNVKGKDDIEYGAQTMNAYAGTFMHELGHNLGLGHGGNQGVENYKPNYRSIMNYYYQFPGLPSKGQRIGQLDYSPLRLPDLDENHLDERAGVDPGITSDGIGTYGKRGVSIRYKTEAFKDKEEPKRLADVFKASIDWNKDGKIESDIKANINSENGDDYSLLTGFNDWDHLVYYAGGEFAAAAIGASDAARGASAAISESDEKPNKVDLTDELTIDEAIKMDVLANPGTASIDPVGPFTLIKDAKNQKLYLDIQNPTQEAADFTVEVSGDLFDKPKPVKVHVDGSTQLPLSATRVSFPVNASLSDGDHTVNVRVTGETGITVKSSCTVNVYAPTAEERQNLKDAIDKGEIKDLPDVVLAGLKEALTGSFSDVPANHWVVTQGWLGYATSHGLMGGYQGRFAPEGPLTRGQVAAVLYRIANPGSDATTNPAHYGTDTGFKDGGSQRYYYAAVKWLKDRGISTGDKRPDGTPLGTFRPDANITRQELAAMVYRFAKAQGADMSGSRPLDGFRDAGQVQPYAAGPLSWCLANGVITGGQGSAAGLLAPGTNATRAQAAKIFTVVHRDVLKR